jgi:hypothetical protein
MFQVFNHFRCNPAGTEFVAWEFLFIKYQAIHTLLPEAPGAARTCGATTDDNDVGVTHEE